MVSLICCVRARVHLYVICDLLCHLANYGGRTLSKCRTLSVSYNWMIFSIDCGATETLSQNQSQSQMLTALCHFNFISPFFFSTFGRLVHLQCFFVIAMYASLFSASPSSATFFAHNRIFVLWKCYKIYDAFHFLILLVPILLFAFISVFQHEQQQQYKVNNIQLVSMVCVRCARAFVSDWNQRRQLFSTNYAFPINSRRSILEPIQNRSVRCDAHIHTYMAAFSRVHQSEHKFSHSKNKSISFEFYRLRQIIVSGISRIHWLLSAHVRCFWSSIESWWFEKC